MTGGIEAAGDAIAGGLIARAVEPRGGEAAGGAAPGGADTGRADAVGADGHTHEDACLNCGTVLVGPHCHQCGQHAHIHRTLWAIGHDILHGVFHFEGKLWRTLPLLAWRPGQLTRRYIHGQRARFVSPLALFLFSVFLMFAVFESVGGPIRSGVNLNRDGVKIETSEFKAELAKARTKLAGLEQQRAAAVASRSPTVVLDQQISDVTGDIAGLTAATAVANGVQSDSLALPKSLQIETGSKEFDARVKEAFKDPKFLLYKLQSSAYKFAWALIPLSLPFMWLIFAWRRHYRLYDHAVFVTYSLSFVMILLVTMALAAAAGASTLWALTLVPVHMFRQLKQAYALGWFSALWRTVALLCVATTVLTLFATALLALGVLG